MISLKGGKIGPRLLFVTNRKSHTRFRLVPRSMTLDDLERLLRTLFKIHAFSEPTTKFWMKIDPCYQRGRCSPMTVVSGNIKFMRIFIRWSSLDRGVKRHWETDELLIARFCVLFARISCLEWNSLLSIYSSWMRGKKPGRLLKVIRFSHNLINTH